MPGKTTMMFSAYQWQICVQLLPQRVWDLVQRVQFEGCDFSCLEHTFAENIGGCCLSMAELKGWEDQHSQR